MGNRSISPRPIAEVAKNSSANPAFPRYNSASLFEWFSDAMAMSFNPIPKFSPVAWFLLGITLFTPLEAAQALPGQASDQVATWIQANPTLKPNRGEKLMVRKSDSAAQRFIFEASLLSPGRLSASKSGGFIRSEKLTLFDMLNGITKYRLEESLRSVYGPDLFQDYDRAKVVYTYPSPGTRQQSINQKAPLLEALQGELRQGDRYAYWLEIAQSKDSVAYAGRVTVFLKEDLDKLTAELKSR
jgi:hypothetical protein